MRNSSEIKCNALEGANILLTIQGSTMSRQKVSHFLLVRDQLKARRDEVLALRAKKQENQISGEVGCLREETWKLWEDKDEKMDWNWYTLHPETVASEGL